MTPGERITIVTGGQGTGKTSFCFRVIDNARRQQIDVAGIASPAEFTGDVKTGIWAVDVRTGEKKSLAVLQQGEPSGISTIRWRFDENNLIWGNKVLAKSIPCSLLIVDELGPLEFDRGLGWLSGFTALDSGAFQAGLAVIRPELLEKALWRWSAAQVIEIRQSVNLDSLARKWLEQVGFGGEQS